MSLTAAAVTVSTSATELCEGNPRRTLVTFTNNGAVTVYVGGSDVSASAFLFVLPAGGELQVSNEFGDQAPMENWWGVAASSSASVSVGEAKR